MIGAWGWVWSYTIGTRGEGAYTVTALLVGFGKEGFPHYVVMSVVPRC